MSATAHLFGQNNEWKIRYFKACRKFSGRLFYDTMMTIMVMMTCEQCGHTRNSNPAAVLCANCRRELDRDRFNLDQEQRIKALGYVFHGRVSGIGVHSKVDVTNLECGHRFVAKTNNILNKATVCGVCGPTKRAANALKHYVAKYGRTYDLTKWRDYLGYVRQLSDELYFSDPARFNPDGLPRTRADLHRDAVNLDHIIPIIYGFKHGLPPELLADPRNLRITSAAQNLSKKQKLTDEARALLEVLKPT